MNVYLSGLTKPLVRDVMMAIEAPEHPLALTPKTADGIGDFYAALLLAFHQAAPHLSPHGQLSERIGSDVARPVTGLADVERAPEIIREQGEGTGASPAEAFGNDRPAHYYAFGEIYHGRRLRLTDGAWQYTGAPVPFPDARPMARVPAGGRPHPSPHAARLLDRFDAIYNGMLHALDRAWNDDNPRALRGAVHAMRGLEHPALELMEPPLPNAPGTYGPRFRPSNDTAPEHD